MTQLPHHHRYDFSPIKNRPDFSWPGGKRLAVYVGMNLECFSFGEGEGASLASSNPAPDVQNYAWRDYGNRVGVWRMIELLDELDLPCTVLANSAMYAHAGPVMDVFRARGDEVAAHGRTNSEQPGEMKEAKERGVIEEARDVIAEHEGTAPKGWLAPSISQSHVTPDLLEEAGYQYLMDWAHDEQPVWMKTRNGRILSVPYPQELNDLTQVMGRQNEAPDFARMILDAFGVHLAECGARPAVMGLALHPYFMGQPHRFMHLQQALRELKARADDRVWFTTAGAINDHYRGLGVG